MAYPLEENEAQAAHSVAYGVGLCASAYAGPAMQVLYWICDIPAGGQKPVWSRGSDFRYSESLYQCFPEHQ